MHLLVGVTINYHRLSPQRMQLMQKKKYVHMSVVMQFSYVIHIVSRSIFLSEGFSTTAYHYHYTLLPPSIHTRILGANAAMFFWQLSPHTRAL